ncbi:MAG: hypothetical protein R3C49_27170 [Planctomycetaceae bacterium]
MVQNLSGAIFTTIDAQTYEFSNLAPLTSEAGSYEFRLVVAGSGIVDTDSGSFAAFRTGNRNLVSE